jgi:osmotically-inducible protein OsmY
MTTNDEKIQQNVANRLSRSSRINSNDIKVEVSNGVVSLSGTLPSLSVCMAAVKEAEKAAGVRRVNNNLKVMIPKAT